MAKFNPPFAFDGKRRSTTPDEQEKGIPCRPFERDMWNGLFHDLQMELGNLISASGQEGSTSDLLQTAKAIQSGKLNYAVAGGTADALTVTLNPALTSYAVGMHLHVKIAATNTGAATLNANNLGPLPIQTLRGADIAAQDLPINAIVTLVCTGTTWTLISLAYSEVRQTLRGDLTLYIRPDGNDSNDGLTNTAIGAFKTIAGAWAAVRDRYDTGSYKLTLQLAPGTYAGYSFPVFPGQVVLRGDPAVRANCIITCPPGASHVIRSSIRSLRIEGCVLNYTFTGPNGGVDAGGETTVSVYDMGSIYVVNCNYQSNNSRPSLNHNLVDSGCLITNTGTVGINGAALIRNFADAIGGGIFLGSAKYSSVGTLPINNYFVTASLGAITNFAQGNFVNIAATGARYNANMGGIIGVGGGGANFLPGSAPGVTTNGGIYA